MTNRILRMMVIIGICSIAVGTMIFGEDMENPLLKSWAIYSKMKEASEFRLEWISIGPVMNSARVEAVQADPRNPNTMYTAFGSGNLWKSVNGGLTWIPIFENQSALGIGDIALAPSDPDVIWLGSGESLKKARNFTMPGTGVFRSDDGGKTWKNLGLHDSYHIGEIAVHPEYSDTAFVAVLGHFWTTNPNRGLYRTKDGGKTWDHVLYIDERVGANDVVIAPSNPDVIYVSMWENYPDVFGPRSGVYKSTDCGKTWERLGGGLPHGPRTGRIGLAVSWSNPDKVYALVDNLNKKEKLTAEVYRTLDGGQSWSQTHEKELLIFPGIGWYFADCYVNPKNDEELFALGVRLAHSPDGGHSLQLVGGEVYHLFPNASQTLHLDHCEMWISPGNPDHLILGNDGGLYVSRDKGKTWLHLNNIPAGEFYDISAGPGNPYLVYGGTQDDSSVCGPARELRPPFPDGWDYVWLDAWSGGDGCYTFPDPEDPETVYFSSQNGAARRKNMKTGRSVSIRPRLPKNHPGKLQYNFVTPYFISQHNHLTLYHAGNYVFKSLDRGDHWWLISPDLSKSSDPKKQSTAAGAAVESPIKPGLLYIGTDKGAFWVTENDGTNWVERSEGLPAHYIRSICPSRFSADRVYVAVTGINDDDFGTYLFISDDRGRSWDSISANLPGDIVYVIQEDPTSEDILYAGLYRGVYISTDRGKSWSQLGPGLPAAAISDLVIQEETMDLVAGTHGRGIYVMNLRPIQEAFKDGGLRENKLLETPVARLPWFRDTHGDPDLLTVEKVPITFFLTEPADLTLAVQDESGKDVWSLEFSGKKGFNQFRWDLVAEDVENPDPYFIHYRRFIQPGRYTIRVSGDGIDLSGFLTVEPRSSPDF
jgi:photosystem II stability/assembly factor-like uncharacterized protein